MERGHFLRMGRTETWEDEIGHVLSGAECGSKLCTGLGGWGWMWWVGGIVTTHLFNGHKFGQILGDGEGEGSRVCRSPWGRKESDTAWQLHNSNNKDNAKVWWTPGSHTKFLNSVAKSLTSFIAGCHHGDKALSEPNSLCSRILPWWTELLDEEFRNANLKWLTLWKAYKTACLYCSY